MVAEFSHIPEHGSSQPGAGLSHVCARNRLRPFALNTNPLGKHWSTSNQAFDARGGTGKETSPDSTTDWNFFATDTFNFKPTVTVTYGLRYEYQHLPKSLLSTSTDLKYWFPGPAMDGGNSKLSSGQEQFRPSRFGGMGHGRNSEKRDSVGGGIYDGRTRTHCSGPTHWRIASRFRVFRFPEPQHPSRRWVLSTPLLPGAVGSVRSSNCVSSMAKDM